jgi:hypothetical protein
MSRWNAKKIFFNSCFKFDNEFRQIKCRKISDGKPSISHKYIAVKGKLNIGNDKENVILRRLRHSIGRQCKRFSTIT